MRPEEKEAMVRERTIAKMTNIDNEDFTHSYCGVSVTIQAGREMVGRLPEIEHLAKHLARKILSREAKKRLDKKDAQGKLWTPEQVEELQNKMIAMIGSENPPEQMSEKALREADRKKITEGFASPEPPKPIGVTKKEVIDELKKRGAEVDISQTKEELLKQLMDLESQGK